MAFHDGIMEFRTPARTTDPAIVSEPPGRTNSVLLDQAFTRMGPRAPDAPNTQGDAFDVVKPDPFARRELPPKRRSIW